MGGFLKQDKHRAPLLLMANRSGYSLARKIHQELQKKLEVELRLPEVNEFACGEFKVSLGTGKNETVRGKDVYLIQCPIDKTSIRTIQDNIWETLLTIDTLKNCHARHTTVVIPCMPYVRQDKRDGREPLSALVMAKVLAAAGADAVITLDPHFSQLKGYFEAVGVLPDILYPTHSFIQYIKQRYGLANLVILAPDPGAAKRAVFYADHLFGEGHLHDRVVFTTKKRSVANQVDFLTIQGEVKGKTVLITDDMIDTAGTMQKVIHHTLELGARQIIACCTHPILSGSAIARLDELYEQGGFAELLTSDTVVHPDGFQEQHRWFNQISVAPILAEFILRINQEKETSSLYL
ncbi:MAG: ribose-phosphate pyrophosphokinase [Candidatus Woesearchaeota archaeon]